VTERCEDCPKNEVRNFMEQAHDTHEQLFTLVRDRVPWAIFLPIIVLLVTFLGGLSMMQIESVKESAKQQVETLNRINVSQEKISCALQGVMDRISENDKRISITEQEIRHLNRGTK